jgi:hypothetical protein
LPAGLVSDRDTRAGNEPRLTGLFGERGLNLRALCNKLLGQPFFLEVGNGTERYLETMVDPTINDLESNPTSIRHAFLACVVVFHSLDYLTHPKSTKNRRFLFRKQSVDFAIVDRVAHAFKHVKAGHRDDADNQPLKAEAVVARPPMYYNKTGAYGLSRWDDAIGGVTLDNNRHLDLLSIVKRATAFIRSQIDASKPLQT